LWKCQNSITVSLSSPGAKDLLQKLAAFEAETLKPAQEKITGARKQAVTLLEAEMVSATRAGDLEGALAIKAEMERLQKPVSLQIEEGEEPTGTLAQASTTPSASTRIAATQPALKSGSLLEQLEGTVWGPADNPNAETLHAFAHGGLCPSSPASRPRRLLRIFSSQP